MHEISGHGGASYGKAGSAFGLSAAERLIVRLGDAPVYKE